MKKIINQFLNLFGYSITKKKNFEKIYRTLDTTIKNLIKNKSPIIIDVGAHEGESINRFRNIFKSAIIHSFEPQNKCFEILKKLKDKNTFINNYGLGDKKEIKKINILNENASSSIHNIDKNSPYLKELKIVEKQDITLDLLDNYLTEKKINFVDVLKIDVQGYEDKVLKGAINSLGKKIYLIELEIIFIDYYEKKKSFLEIEQILNPLGFELYSLTTPNFAENYRIKWVDALYINKNLL